MGTAAFPDCACASRGRLPGSRDDIAFLLAGLSINRRQPRTVSGRDFRVAVHVLSNGSPARRTRFNISSPQADLFDGVVDKFCSKHRDVVDGEIEIVERRAHHRYQLAFRVAVEIINDGRRTVAEAGSVEISRGGATLSCDDTLIGALLAQEHFPRTCTLAFSVPPRDVAFTIDGHVARYRRLSQQCYHLVVVFSRFEIGDADTLADCLERCGSKQENTAGVTSGTLR